MVIVDLKEANLKKQSYITGILELQKQFGERMRRHNFRHWMALGLTAVQLKSLFYIVKVGNASSKKLSDALGVTPANITGVMDRLIDQGLVQRVENPADRRITFLKATDKGEKLFANLEEYADVHLAKLLSSLKDEELEHLYLGLSAFIRSWDNIHKDKPMRADL